MFFYILMVYYDEDSFLVFIIYILGCLSFFYVLSYLIILFKYNIYLLIY